MNMRSRAHVKKSKEPSGDQGFIEVTSLPMLV